MIGIKNQCSRQHKGETIATMPAKSLGTLAMVYAIGKLQNPLLHETMLCKGDVNNSARRSDAFLRR